jgi:hypothetical protein
MRVLRFLSALVLASVIAIGPLLAQQKLSANDAKNHIGETATVCGSVVSTHYAPGTKGQPTFLNLDKPYPNPVFTVLIWGENRSKFWDARGRVQGEADLRHGEDYGVQASG